eukprot:TRINITY_DN10799_c0_g1_i1.p1 TRINITY_DN10799_c0_g1~~TRINITY_DN10799_c0_g1_i1.p1  ORF type:complete len:337 (-),score=92.91 TRINITY_DN10799_c0_g1_i1:39-1049(-)
MFNKIQETKTNLKHLKEEQLQTTTRLTVLQNHQLTTELEYQSRQTEKLLEKNNRLQEEVSTLKRDIEIHKQVEDELAKRAQNSQKTIKKLNESVKSLEEEANMLENEKFLNTQAEKKKVEGVAEEKTKDELILFLEQNINFSEKKLAKLKNSYEILRNDFEDLQKASENKRKFGLLNLPWVLIDCLELFIDKSGDKFGEDLDDVSEKELSQTLVSKEYTEWEKEHKMQLVRILMNRIRSYLTKQNLRITDSSESQRGGEKSQMTAENEELGDEEDDDQMFPEISQKVASVLGGMHIRELLKKKKLKNLPIEVGTSILKSELRECCLLYTSPSPRDS